MSSKIRYRSRLAIVSNILQMAQAGNATKTRLMFGSFLSLAQINEYLGFLVSKGLIMRGVGTHIYALTEKGARLLRMYAELSQLVPFDETFPAVLISAWEVWQRAGPSEKNCVLSRHGLL